MSSIKFDATLDTDKLNASIKESNKTVDAWVKGVESGTMSMDRAIEKTTKTQRTAIQHQKEFIKGLIAEIKEMEKAADKVSYGIAKRDAVIEIKNAQRTLVEARADLNRLQNETIVQNKEEQTTQEKIIDSLKRWGLGLLTVTGAIKVFKSFIASSNTLNTEFETSISGAKGALQDFYQIFSAEANLKGNPITNLIKSFKGAKELAEEMDLYSRSMQSNQVLIAKEEEAVREQEKIFRNASNAAKDREEALNEWLRIKKIAADRELKIEQDLNEALLKEIKNRPNLQGITDKQIETFATIYATNPDLAKQAQDLYRIGTTAEGMGVAGIKKYRELEAEIKAALPVGVEFDDLMSSIRLNVALNDEQITALTDSFKRLFSAQSGGEELDSMVARWLGSITNKADEADKLLNDLNYKIEENKRLLNEAIASNNQTEMRAIAAKIVELQKELSLREKIAKQLIDVASYEPGFVPTAVQAPGMGSTSSAIQGKAKQKKQKTLAEIKQEMNQLRGMNMKVLKDNEKKQDEINKKQEEADEKRKRNQEEILQGALKLTYQLGEQLGLSQEELNVLGSTLDAFGSLASGDYIGAAISLISGLMALMPNEAAKFAQQIEEINALIEKQQRLIDLSERKGGTDTATQGEIELLKEQQALYEQQLKNNQAKLKERKWSFFGLGGLFTGGIKKDIADINESLQDTINQIEDAEQSLADYFSGGITENSIADVIAQGFQDGKTSVDDFADYMNQVLIDAVLNIFKAEILGPALSTATEFISNALSDNVLTQTEKSEIERLITEAAETNKQLWDDLTGTLDFGNGPEAGLSGGISRSITEDTASELAGLMRRIADDVRVGRDYDKVGITHLANIEANTFNTVEELKLAVVELKGINGNTKPGYSGSL